jgi:hypothetical protein
MVALRLQLGTVADMTSRSPAAAATRPTRRPPLEGAADVLGSVASALEAGADGDDWLVLEAWALAITAVTLAALQAVPDELHDLL